jgi:geranylgeranyl diphosphate synthase type I
MHESLGDYAGFLHETAEYVLSAPGKLLRPLLLLDACRAVGGDPAAVFPAAIGTEYGHIASLIHDDIMDGDHQRRGQDTLHVKYNLPSALLTGDYLIFQTYLSYTECQQSGIPADRILQAIQMLSVTCIEMSRGQAVEEKIAGDLDINEEHYLELIRLKTASFCRAAAGVGACLGGGSAEEQGALSAYGTNLGLAFQIMDDVLSYDGTTRMGKPLTSDVRNRRVTLPIIYALQSGGQRTHDEIVTIFGDTTISEEDAHARLVHILVQTRAIERARAVAYRYTTRAKLELARLPHSDSRARLEALADIFLTRDH